MNAIEPILVLSTTNRPHALTTTVATYYAALLQRKKVPTTLLKLVDLPADFTSTALYANKRKNPAFNRFLDLLDRFQKYVWIVPQYNGSFPGVLKAFLDGYAVPNVFAGKKCALVGVSKGKQGAVMGLSHLTDILHYLGMTIYPMQPKLSEMPDTTLAALEARPHYLRQLEGQAGAFIDF